MGDEMTKHHYEIIARAIREELEGWVTDGDGAYAVRCVADQLAYAFSQDNPSFDRQRFLTACGVIS